MLNKNSNTTPNTNVGRITVTQLVLMIAAAVTSLRGVPIMSQEELTMFIYLVFAAVLFLIPAAMVSAELGTTYANDGGGIYTWVKEAYNKRIGFIAIFLQWIQNVVWYPTTLAFGAAAISYIIGKPELAVDGKFIGSFSIIIYWLSTWVSLKKTSIVSKISSSGFLYGTIIPLLVLIVIAIIWATNGNSIAFNHIPASQTEIAVTIDGITEPRFIPHLTNLNNIVFLSTIVLLFAGIEALAVHASELKNPKKDYPKALFIASILSFLILALGALAVSVILPYEKITLQAGVMETFRMFFDKYNINWLTNVLSVFVLIGCASCIISWMTGPSKALLFTARDGELPKFLSVVNKNGIQQNILIVQAIIVTILCSLYFLIDDVSVAFFLLSSLNATLYLIMYMIMYLSCIRLRKLKPDYPRPFKIPGGINSLRIFAGVGFAAVTIAFILSFIPPSQLPISSPQQYVAFITIATIFFIAIPIIISKLMNNKNNAQ